MRQNSLVKTPHYDYRLIALILAMVSLITVSSAVMANALRATSLTLPVIHPHSACIEAPTADHCQGKGATVYPWFWPDAPIYWNLNTNNTSHCSSKPEQITQTEREEITTLLARLPDSALTIPRGLLSEYLAGAGESMTFTGFAEKKDRLVTFYTQKHSSHEPVVWLRLFEGKDPADTVYWIAIGAFCEDINEYLHRHGLASLSEPATCLSRQIADTKVFPDTRDKARQEQRQAVSKLARGYALRAYRKDKQGDLREVSHEVLPALSQISLSKQELAHYWEKGFSGVFMDDISFATACNKSVFRWLATLDQFPDSRKPASRLIIWMPQQYDDIEYDERVRYLPLPLLHFGFIAWNGKTFSYYHYLPRQCVYQGLMDETCQQQLRLHKNKTMPEQK